MDRFAFQIGSLSVTWYGICVAAGFWLGAWMAARRAPRIGINSDTVWDLLWVLILAGIVGSRVLYVATYWDRDFRDKPLSEIFMVHHGGLVFHGGFIAAMIAGFAWAAWKKIEAWPMADLLAPSIALGHALGRIGCFVNGCCYGRRCDLPWGVRYPSRYELPDIPVHPTQIYEAALSLALAAALGWLLVRRRFDGQVFAIYLMGYALLRAFVELYRGDYPVSTLYFGVITPAHWMCAGLFLLGLVIYFFRRRTCSPAIVEPTFRPGAPVPPTA